MLKVTDAMLANAPACLIRNVLDQVGNKWSLLVLMSLQGRRRRFMEVKRSIGDITQRVLTQTLRRLERDGHVSRQVYPTSPPTVEYRLTPTGASLLKPMGKLVRWANVHLGEVAVRQSRNQRNGNLTHVRRRRTPRSPRCTGAAAQRWRIEVRKSCQKCTTVTDCSAENRRLFDALCNPSGTSGTARRA